MRSQIWWTCDYLLRLISPERQLVTMEDLEKTFSVWCWLKSKRSPLMEVSVQIWQKNTRQWVWLNLWVLESFKMVKFHTIPEEVLNEIVQGSSLSTCIKYLQKGLQKVAILQLMMRLPIFLYLFRPSDRTGLSVKKLTHLLVPTFNEAGSNSRSHAVPWLHRTPSL